MEVERLQLLVDSELSVERAEAALAHSKRMEARLKQLSKGDMVSDADLEDRELEARIAHLKLEQVKLDRVIAVNDLKQAKAPARPANPA